jgi:hypothetical protein
LTTPTPASNIDSSQAGVPGSQSFLSPSIGEDNILFSLGTTASQRNTSDDQDKSHAQEK